MYISYYGTLNAIRTCEDFNLSLTVSIHVQFSNHIPALPLLLGPTEQPDQRNVASPISPWRRHRRSPKRIHQRFSTIASGPGASRNIQSVWHFNVSSITLSQFLVVRLRAQHSCGYASGGNFVSPRLLLGFYPTSNHMCR